MHLQRVQVPDFRVLKDVDITFEKNFNPRVFPLGSQNGGGKSTLLQLIFVLLHCSTNPDRIPSLNNLLSSFLLRAEEDRRELAVIDIWDGQKTVQLNFFVVNTKYLKEYDKSLDDSLEDKFYSLAKNIQQQGISKEESKQSEFYRDFFMREIIKNIALRDNTTLITSYVNVNEMNYPHLLTLLCNINNLGTYRPNDFLNRLSSKIFLAAPSTQIFLFLDKKSRNSLLTNNSIYQSNLKEINDILTNLFTYDFLATELLTDFFKSMRDKDFKEAIKNDGEYGNNYKQSLQNLNLLLNNKLVNLSEDFSSVTFKLSKLDSNIDLYPEDLSHGELKRLSIYVWLKHQNIKDAIVLMDEVDLALHPDWQYQIVSDLVEWEASNQYILATHSYELCQALTPSHVKVLEPKLTERRSD